MTPEELKPAEELIPAREHRWIAGGFTERVHGALDWDAPAPVDGWVARDVVRHLIDWFPPFLERGSGIRLDAVASVDDDPVAAWDARAAAIQALLDDPEVAASEFREEHVGQLPLGAAIHQFYTGDVFMHTWDLARATGQDETLDATLCAQMLAGMEAYEDAMRSSGQYGPRVEVPADADAQTRLLAFIGRDPGASSD